MRFSERYAASAELPDVSIRDDAPQFVRDAYLASAKNADLRPSQVRELVCAELLEAPDYGCNWTEYPNIAEEAQDLVANCEWYKVYDLIEKTYRVLLGHDHFPDIDRDYEAALQFESGINRLFEGKGVGWRLEEGELRSRGDEAFEISLQTAKDRLKASGRTTALDEVHSALEDLFRRPNPDLTGAIQHIGAALDCVARDLVGDPNATFGQILKKHPGLLPKPLDEAASKIWGFLSENGRHVREGGVPDRDVVEVSVGLGANLISYLTK